MPRSCTGNEWRIDLSPDGFLRGAKFLIYDRDPLVTEAFAAILRPSGVASLKARARAAGLDSKRREEIACLAGEARWQSVPLGERTAICPSCCARPRARAIEARAGAALALNAGTPASLPKPPQQEFLQTS